MPPKLGRALALCSILGESQHRRVLIAPLNLTPSNPLSVCVCITRSTHRSPLSPGPRHCHRTGQPPPTPPATRPSLPPSPRSPGVLLDAPVTACGLALAGFGQRQWERQARARSGQQGGRHGRGGGRMQPAPTIQPHAQQRPRSSSSSSCGSHRRRTTTTTTATTTTRAGPGPLHAEADPAGPPRPGRPLQVRA